MLELLFFVTCFIWPPDAGFLFHLALLIEIFEGTYIGDISSLSENLTQNLLVSLECVVVKMPLFSLTFAAQRDRIHVKHDENDKSLTSCSKAASYIKVK